MTSLTERNVVFVLGVLVICDMFCHWPTTDMLFLVSDRWSRRRWPRESGTCASQSTGTTRRWSQPAASCDILGPSFMRQWRDLSPLLTVSDYINPLSASHFIRFQPAILMPWFPVPRISERRTTPKAKLSASFFLQSINSEAVLQIAMMCDAAQEELELSPVLN